MGGSLLISILIIIASSFFIYLAGKKFAESSSKIGDYFRIPRDVKGATLDAISSSLPELLVALFAVIIFKQFEVGIGTIAGSALFNLLVIPGICVFLAPIAFKVGRKVIARDALFYLISIFALIILIIYFKKWGIIISLILIAIYLIYIFEIATHTKKHRRENQDKKGKSKKGINITKEFIIFFLTMAVIAFFAYLLTDHSIQLSNFLGVPAIIIAFTVTAAATSLPDTIISASNARKGDIDDATSNVFGSNIFDILVGLGLPLLIYTVIKGPLTIMFDNLEIVLGLLGATILTIYFFMNDDILSKKEATILLLLYALFITYVILLSIGIV